MALPEEILDELLSAHLDGELSGDECARVEQMLESDPEVRTRYEALKAQTQWTSQARYSGSGLPDDFALRVLGAAIDAAVEEGCPSDHPLRLAAEGGTTSDGSSLPRVVGIVAAIAASVLFIAFIVRQSDTTSGPAIAGVDSSSGVVTPDETTDGLAETMPAETTPAETLAASETNPDSPEPVVRPDSTVSPTLPVESVAESTPGGNETTPTVANPNVQSPTNGMVASKSTRSLQVLLMVEVRQTEAGRDSGAVDSAMESVQIASGEEQTIDEPLVVAIADNREAAEEPSVDASAERVLLLRAPTKKLDRLVNALYSDQEGISSIQFRLINNAPLLRSVESVLVDPTQIRHPATYWEVVGESAQTFELWRDELGESGFPLQAEMGRQALAGFQDNGKDEMADLLLLIR